MAGVVAAAARRPGLGALPLLAGQMGRLRVGILGAQVIGPGTAG
jgi:hypothetical protein